MKKVTMKKCVKNMALVCLLGALGASSLYAADVGPGVGGGGNSFGGKFLDNYINKRRWDPKAQKAFEEIVKPNLEYIRQNLPQFADDLELILNKDWYLVDKKIKENTSKELIYNADQMAYQTKNSVYVDSNLVTTETTVDDIASMIQHELIQGLRIAKIAFAERHHYEDKDEVGAEAVVALNNRLMNHKAKSPQEMQRIVSGLLKNRYATPSEIKIAEDGVKKELAVLRQKCLEDMALGKGDYRNASLFLGGQKANGFLPYFRMNYFVAGQFEMGNFGGSGTNGVILSVQSGVDDAIYRKNLELLSSDPKPIDGFYNTDHFEKISVEELCNSLTGDAGKASVTSAKGVKHGGVSKLQEGGSSQEDAHEAK